MIKEKKEREKKRWKMKLMNWWKYIIEFIFNELKKEKKNGNIDDHNWFV